MSLKEFTKEIFTRYGLTEDDINVYLRYVRFPRATISQVYVSFEDDQQIEYDKVVQVTNTLAEKGFIKKVEGIIDRYVPLEPFFGLFNKETENFRTDISKIKDEVLSDQSNRFENLEEIQNNSIKEVENAVATQTKAFSDDSDAKSTAKNDRITKAKTRLTDTAKTLESELHAIIEEDYKRTTDDVNKQDKDASDVWDANSAKFTTDNENLNKELTDMVKAENDKLTELSKTQTDASKGQESKIHAIMDTLNSDLNNISGAFVGDNEGGINNAKVNINSLIADLLKDFNTKVQDLEKEMKQSLDNHVERHKNVANELKPKMEQILEKYLERMNKIVTDLKQKITSLLKEHVKHINTTTDNLQNELKSKVDNKQATLKEQVTSYKTTALTLLKNLIDTAQDYTGFSEGIQSVGFFFGKGKKRKYIDQWEVVEQKVASISNTFEEDYVNHCNNSISNTQKTATELKTDIDTVVSTEKKTLATETTDLDQKAQETISAELETLATDMASEIDNTLQGGIKDCSETTIKLKDSVEKSFAQHNKQYDTEINRHKDDTLRHYDDFNTDIKRKNETWIKDIDGKFTEGKRDLTTEIESQNTNIDAYKAGQIKNVNDLLGKVTAKNVEHSETFGNDVGEVKTKQRALYDDLLAKIRADSDKSKTNTSGKIDAEIKLWDEESADIDKNLSDMLTDHKTKYEENAKKLQESLSTTAKDNAQNVKDAIADFTLNFMNAIDDATELGESNEEKLKDIHTASSAVEQLAKITTWFTVGRTALISAMKDAIYRTKSSVIIVTPIVVPEILQLISEFAYKKKAARFMATSKWDMQTYGPIIKKMLQLGNIQFRNLTTEGEYYACTRDAEEVILCPFTTDEAQMISMVSTQPGYAKLYSQVIGPMFLSNSRPIK